jgi:hypothetical protein
VELARVDLIEVESRRERVKRGRRGEGERWKLSYS